MKNSFDRILLPLLHHCRQSVRMYLDIPLDKSLLEICQITLSRSIVIDLFLSPATIQQLEANAFLSNQLLELIAKGLNVYASANFQPNKPALGIIQVDFKQTHLYKIDASNELIEGIPYEGYFSLFEQGHWAYRSEKQDITLHCKAKDSTVFKGRSTLITWSAAQADSVQIDGLGEVKSSGEEAVRVLDDTILIVRASNRHQTKCRAIFLKTLYIIAIYYDVQFLNPASKEFVSLKTDNSTDGIFGVSKENKVKLVWNVDHAEEVLITPFNIREKTGEYVFQPNGSIEINIQAIVQGKAKNQRIIIHEYPMPVFLEKMVHINGDFVSKVELSLQSHKESAYRFLKQKNLISNDAFAEKLRAFSKEQEEKLMQRYHQLRFSSFYETHSLDRLNRTILQRLKAYFKAQPDVVNMINLLHKSEHEHRNAQH